MPDVRKQKAAREDAGRGYVRLWNSGRQSRVPVFPATGRVYGWLDLRANQRADAVWQRKPAVIRFAVRWAANMC